MKGEKDCDGSAYEELIDPATARRRLEGIVEAALAVEEYGRAHDRIVAAGVAQPSCQPGLKASLTERAYAAERAVRSVLAYHLDALNEIRDAGAMGRMVEEATSAFEQHDWDWRRILDRAIEGDDGELGIDPAILSRAAEASRKLDLKVMPGGEGTIGAELTDLTGERRRFLVRGRPRPGDLARVSSEDLLGGTGVLASLPLVVASDCHHRGSSAVQPEAIDLYRANVAALAYCRENIYLHARTVDELGPSAFRGEDGVTVFGVICVIIGAIAIGVGANMVAHGNPWGVALIVIGAIFVGGGICFAVGACELAIGLGPVDITA